MSFGVLDTLLIEGAYGCPQGGLVTAEWPLGVLTYTSESTVPCGIRTVMRTSPLHVLLQVADTSGPWMAGGVVRLLLFLYTFPWAMLQYILYQYYLTFGFIKLGLCFRLLPESGALCLSFNFRGIPFISLFHNNLSLC